MMSEIELKIKQTLSLLSGVAIEEMKFNVYWRGCLLGIHINHSKTEISLMERPKRGKIIVDVYGERKELKPKSSTSFSYASSEKNQKPCRKKRTIRRRSR